MNEITDATVIRDAAYASVQREATEGGGLYAVLPEGHSVHSLEDMQPHPNRASTNLKLRDTASLAAYVNRFRTGTTVLFSSPAKGQIQTVIDYHSQTTPSHCSHVATFIAQHTPPYAAWRRIHGKRISQVEAGMFLEERAVDVVEPDAASIMEMVMQFDALKRVTFKQSTRLHDGQRQFTYNEENEARGNVTLPERITLLVPVYDGQEPDRIPVRVKYRIEDGALRFSFEIHERERVELEAFARCEDALVEAIKVDTPFYSEV